MTGIVPPSATHTGPPKGKGGSSRSVTPKVKDRFGFLIHPLGMTDVVRYAPNARGKREPLVAKILEWMPPYEAAAIRGVRSHTGKEITGHFVTVPMLPRQFLEMDKQWVLDRVVQAALLAQSLGAQVVGLGGYNSVVGDAGRVVAENLDVSVTSGNSYTVATALEATLQAAMVMDLDLSKANLAIIGATGSIGSVCARMLARQVGRLNLVARSKSRLQLLAERIHSESRAAIGIEMDLERGIREADVIISASASGGSIIRPEFLKRGAVVCDVALPHDVCREVAKTRPDVLVIEGGVVEVPGTVEFNFDFGYPPNMALACMAETMVLTLENRCEDFSIGRGLQFEKVDEIARLAHKHGFRPAGFRAFDEPITREKIEAVKYHARQTRSPLTILG
jgi:fatty aldehyde-generating acyl-ACP reductase